MKKALLCTAVVTALVAGIGSQAGAGAGGPAPGVAVGWDGARAPGSPLRYVALPSGAGRTTVAAISVRSGRVIRYRGIEDELGVPLVTFNGTTDGVSADGKRLVLASSAQPGSASSTRFAVLRTATLRLERAISLPGAWAFDALSPDGSTIFALEYLAQGDVPVYRVRAVDVASGRPLPGAIVDSRDPAEKMLGVPYARANGNRGRVYTLYAKPDGTAFVHALDTLKRTARCIDLPWRGVGNAIPSVQLVVHRGTLMLRQPGVGRLAAVDTSRLEVRAFRRPVAAA